MSNYSDQLLRVYPDFSAQDPVFSEKPHLAHDNTNLLRTFLTKHGGQKPH